MVMSKTFQARVPEQIHALLTRDSKTEERSLNWILNRILRQYYQEELELTAPPVSNQLPPS